MVKNIDIYQEMTPKEISELFNKKLPAVNMGISRMIKEHPDWKKKNGRNVIITPQGVEWLVDYFVLDETPVVFNEDKFKLEMEIKRLTEILEVEREHKKEITTLIAQQYQERLEESKRTFLLENESKNQTIEVLQEGKNRIEEELQVVRDALQTTQNEVAKFKKSLFGFYRKK